MIFEKSDRMILFRLCLLGASVFITGIFFHFQQPAGIIVMAILMFFQLVGLYRFYIRIKKEVQEFAESTHYRDFSRNYDTEHAPAELQPLRKGFNEINSTLKIISKEKETQHQYLQKVLEIVNTAILSYEQETGTINWMNDSFKNLLDIPYLKTIYSLEKKNSDLYTAILAIRVNESKVILVERPKGAARLLLTTTAFQVDGKIFKVIALQNINEVLDENESNAWQKLLSVMTHEIMNSIAPIASLADTLNNRLQHKISEKNKEDVSVLYEDLQLGIDTIKRRSEGLLKFAGTYRNLNKISKPNLAPVYLRTIFENLYRLMEPTLEQKNIEMEVFLRDTNLLLNADHNLIEQALINLVINAIEAVKEVSAPKIILSAEESENKKVIIKIADNGTGISTEQMENIFIPFFTTKKNGTGIGLSLCKQIMMMHKGTIQVQSVERKGTVFLLQFN